MRVRGAPSVLGRNVADAQSSGVDVNVISHKRQRYAVWYGGSLMASTVSTSITNTVRAVLTAARVLQCISQPGGLRRVRPVVGQAVLRLRQCGVEGLHEWSWCLDRERDVAERRWEEFVFTLDMHCMEQCWS